MDKIFIDLSTEYKYPELMKNVDYILNVKNNLKEDIYLTTFTMYRYGILQKAKKRWIENFPETERKLYGNLKNYIQVFRNRLDYLFGDKTILDSKKDLEKFLESDTCILEFNKGRQTGNFVYLGMSIVGNKNIIIVGKQEYLVNKTQYHDHPTIKYVDDIDEALKLTTT